MAYLWVTVLVQGVRVPKMRLPEGMVRGGLGHVGGEGVEEREVDVDEVEVEEEVEEEVECVEVEEVVVVDAV